MNNKKGSAAVEAAVVFPVIILSLMAVMYMFIYFYDQVVQQVNIHSILRSEAGLICENMYNMNQPDTNLPVYREGDRICCYSSVVFDYDGLLKHREHRLYAEKYITDEAAVVRLADYLKTGQVGNE